MLSGNPIWHIIRLAVYLKCHAIMSVLQFYLFLMLWTRIAKHFGFLTPSHYFLFNTIAQKALPKTSLIRNIIMLTFAKILLIGVIASLILPGSFNKLDPADKAVFTSKLSSITHLISILTKELRNFTNLKDKI
jgi:hypothetical protein